MIVVGEVIVVTGPPGAGKSTVAEHLAQLLHLSAVVAGDDFFGFLRNGALDPWRPEAHEQNTVVLEAAAVATGRFAAHCEVVYDGVLGPLVPGGFHGGSRVAAAPLRRALATIAGVPSAGRCPSGARLTDVTSPARTWQESRRAQLDPRHVLTDHGHGSADVARALSEQLLGRAIRYP